MKHRRSTFRLQIDTVFSFSYYFIRLYLHFFLQTHFEKLKDWTWFPSNHASTVYCCHLACCNKYHNYLSFTQNKDKQTQKQRPDWIITLEWRGWNSTPKTRGRYAGMGPTPRDDEVATLVTVLHFTALSDTSVSSLSLSSPSVIFQCAEIESRTLQGKLSVVTRFRYECV